MSFIIFIYGIVFGSFYNVCIYRLPEGKSVISPRSSCSSCGHTLGALDLIPIFSYLISLGKCRYCKSKYSPRYMLVELLTGLLFLLCYKTLGLNIAFLVSIILASVVVIVSFIDIDHHIIFDRFSVIIITVAILYHMFFSNQSLIDISLGFIIGGGFLFIVSLFGTMGGGDIKIMASYGLLLGFINTIIAFYIAFVFGAVILIVFALVKKLISGKYDSKVPFGPFLSFAALITFLYSDIIKELYINFIF